MDLRVGVGTAVPQDGELVVQVGGLAEGGQHDTAGGDAGQGEGVDARPRRSACP